MSTGTAHRGKVKRHPMDQTLLPDVQGQPDAVAALRLGLHPGKLSAAAGATEIGASLVADDAAREADQDWGQGDAARQIRDVPIGRGGGNAGPVRSNPRSNRAAGDPAAAGRAASRMSGSGGQKCSKPRGGSARTLRPTLKSNPNGPFPGLQNRPRRARAEKMPELSRRARRGGHDVKIGTIPSLDRFRAQPIWEMSP